MFFLGPNTVRPVLLYPRINYLDRAGPGFSSRRQQQYTNNCEMKIINLRKPHRDDVTAVPRIFMRCTRSIALARTHGRFYAVFFVNIGKRVLRYYSDTLENPVGKRVCAAYVEKKTQISFNFSLEQIFRAEFGDRKGHFFFFTKTALLPIVGDSRFF